MEPSIGQSTPEAEAAFTRPVYVRVVRAARLRIHVLVVAAVFSVLAFLWVHADLDGAFEQLPDSAGFAVLLAPCLLAGLLIGRWLAITLAFVPLAVGFILTVAGFEAPGYEPVPPWFLPLLFLPLMAAAIAVGVLLRLRKPPGPSFH